MLTQPIIYVTLFFTMLGGVGVGGWEWVVARRRLRCAGREGETGQWGKGWPRGRNLGEKKPRISF